MYDQEFNLQPEVIPDETPESLTLPELVSETFDVPNSEVAPWEEEVPEDSSQTQAPLQDSTEREELEPVISSNLTEEKPFVVTLRQQDRKPNGSFIPTAEITIKSSLRTGGLLQALSGEEVKSLLLLFTFLSPNGDITPSVVELSEALGVSTEKTRERMKKLLEARWNGQSVIASLLRESGLDAYTPTPSILSYTLITEDAPKKPSYHAAGRDRIIAHSRERYTTPRVEVERQIAMQNGWPLPEESLSTRSDIQDPTIQSEEAREYLRQRLHRVGLMREEVDSLFEGYAIEAIEAQLEWLPYRRAKSPSRYLMAAIQGDYDEPYALRAEKQTSLFPG